MIKGHNFGKRLEDLGKEEQAAIVLVDNSEK
jgi:hypothetical protein